MLNETLSNPIWAPRNRPSFSQRSMTLKPSTSQYHLMLASASLAVKEGETLTSADPVDLEVALSTAFLAAARLATDFFAAVVFLGAAFFRTDFFWAFLAAGLAAFRDDFIVFFVFLAMSEISTRRAGRSVGTS